jgi:DHA2 family lincomycin resistance protein-like MFS transporter
LSPAVSLVVGCLCLAIFVWRQLFLQRTETALLDLRTFRTRNFTVSVAVLATTMLALFGTSILIPIYLQNVLGVDVLTSGLVVIPGGLTLCLLSPLVGRLHDRGGPTALVVPGAAVLCATMWFLALITSNATLPSVLAAHVVLSGALSFVLTPLFSTAIVSLPAALYPHGSAVIGTSQQLAGAAGTALFITVMTLVSQAGEEPASPAGLADGIQLAFLCGACIATISAALACFVRRPPGRGVEAGQALT